MTRDVYSHVARAHAHTHTHVSCTLEQITHITVGAYYIKSA